MRIFLIGFMGSGKSVIGKKLASELNIEFFDLDTLLEERYKMTIPGIFEKFGETQFRELETLTLKSIINNDNYVLSCGGGTPCYNDNLSLINNTGISIYIKMDKKSLSERLLKSKTKRPLLKDLTLETLPEKVEQMLIIREEFYSQAHITLEGVGLTVEKIVKSLPEKQ